MRPTLLAVLSFIFLSNVALFGESFKKNGVPYDTMLDFGTSYVNGQTKEIVFRNVGAFQYLSELTWQLSSVFYINTSIKVAPSNPARDKGFFFDISLQIGFPRKVANMVDLDWIAADYQLSHYSSSDTMLTQSVFFDIVVGKSIPIFPQAALRVFGKLSYQRFMWDGGASYLRYGYKTGGLDGDGRELYWPNSSPMGPTLGDFIDGTDGKATTTPYSWESNSQDPSISYRQNWLILSAGAAIDYQPHPRVITSFAFLVAPLTFNFDHDDHWQRSLHTNGYYMLGLAIEPQVNIYFALSKQFGINIDSSYHLAFTTGVRGIEWEADNNEGHPEGRIWEGFGIASSSSFFKLRFGFSVKL